MTFARNPQNSMDAVALQQHLRYGQSSYRSKFVLTSATACSTRTHIKQSSRPLIRCTCRRSKCQWQLSRRPQPHSTKPSRRSHSRTFHRWRQWASHNVATGEEAAVETGEETEEIEVVKVDGRYNPADMFTKQVPAEIMWRHMTTIGYMNREGRAESAVQLVGN